MERLSLLQVVVVAAVTAGAVQLLHYEGTARADAPTKSKLGKTSKTVGPSGEPDSPKAFQFPRGKQSFYIRADSTRIAGNSGAIVDQACDDEDDIAFSSSCVTHEDARLQSERMVNWTRNDRAAAVQCRYFNNTSRPVTVESHIFCLRYDAED